MITSENAVLFSYALWLIGRHDFGLDRKPLRAVDRSLVLHGPHDRALHLLARESQFESDLDRIAELTRRRRRGLRRRARPHRRARTSRSDYWDISLPNRLDTSSPRSPALYAYLAALNLLDAEALFSDVRVRDLLDPGGDCAAVHRAPPPLPAEAPGNASASPATRQVNAIANMAFLDWAENAEISAQRAIDVLAGDDGAIDLGSPAATGALARTAGRLGATRLPDVPRAAPRPHRRRSCARASPPLERPARHPAKLTVRDLHRRRRVADDRVQVVGSLEPCTPVRPTRSWSTSS